MQTLHLITATGRHLLVNERDEIIRTDIPDFQPSGQWLFRGLVPRLRNGPFGYNQAAARKAISDGSILRYVGSLTYKNGKPKFLIADMDHGTYRRQGDGVIRAYVTDEPEEKAKYYYCGGCGHWHPPEFFGDCRDDANRFTTDELEKRHGFDGYEPTNPEDAAADGAW